MKHRRLNAVQQVQNDLQAEFSSQPRVSLKRSVWQHMELLFKSQKDLCDAMATTAKTWRDIKSEEGVREGTAQRVLIEFISLLRKAADGKISDKRLHDQLVPALDALYAPYLTNLNFDELLERKQLSVSTRLSGQRD